MERTKTCGSGRENVRKRNRARQDMGEVKKGKQGGKEGTGRGKEREAGREGGNRERKRKGAGRGKEREQGEVKNDFLLNPLMLCYLTPLCFVT